MPYVGLGSLLPDVAARETRVARSQGEGGLPAGEYAFVELFCDEAHCDCRRTFIQVWGPSSAKNPEARRLATISYGWESEDFYRRWAKYPLDAEELAELKGPALISTDSQSQLAPLLLRMFQHLLLDEAYARRLVRHDEMFQAAAFARRTSGEDLS